ncbi:hypothetical protein ACHAWF_018732 [Thalassiosira exigua]
MGFQNILAHSLPKEVTSLEPTAKRPRMDMNADGVEVSREGREKKKEDNNNKISTVEKRHKLVIWSARRNLPKKGPSSSLPVAADPVEALTWAATYDTQFYTQW